MAPEQVAAAPIDGRADLYAVGVLLFECTTGRRPFEGRTLIELLQQQVHAAPPWPHQLRHDLSPALEGVILKALEKDPARRFQSADEMAAALRAMLPTLTTSEAPAMEAGEGDVTATPGAGVYTPTRKELPVATPGLEAKTERTGSGGRGGQLVAVFVVVLGLTVAAVVAVQTQRQGVIELVPMGGSRRVTPGSALGTGGERGSIAGSGGVVGANGGVNGVGANVGGPGNRALMGSGGANAAGANAVGAVGGSAGSGGVIAANGGENGAGANAAGTGGGANAGSGEASGGVNGAGASATGATGGSDSNVASGGAVGAGAVGERVGSGGVVAANGGETGAGAHGAAAAAGKAGSGGMVAANGAGAKVEGVAVTGAASKAGNATRVGAGAGPTVSAVGGAGAARAPGSSGGTGKKNGPTASEPHPAIASAGKATPEASGDAVKPSTGGGVVIINTKAQLENLPADYDPKHFDVFGYAARARALAAERMSDAILINVDADGVAADGHADLTLSRDYEARYWFRSPSRSVVNPALPARDQDIVCKVYITATAKGIERHLASSSDGCTEKPLPKWRCTLPQAMQKGASLGARTDRVGKVAFLTDGTWLIDQGDGPNETIYFSCP